MFKDEFIDKWKRLNPRYGQPGGGLKANFLPGFYESLYGYFAPLRMAWWLAWYASLYLLDRMLRKRP